MDKEKGCLDVNECAAPKSPCTPLQFCVNTEGGYRCLDCDRSCAGCTGDGPDMCINCASGYYKKDNMCIGKNFFQVLFLDFDLNEPYFLKINLWLLPKQME